MALALPIAASMVSKYLFWTSAAVFGVGHALVALAPSRYAFR
jgi:hypothetical protein